MDWKVVAVIGLILIVVIRPFWPFIKFAIRKATGRSVEADYNKFSWWTEFFGQ